MQEVHLDKKRAYSQATSDDKGDIMLANWTENVLVEGFASTNAYVEADSIDVKTYGSVGVFIKNTGLTNTITYNVEGLLDDAGEYLVSLATADLAQSASYAASLSTGAYRIIRVSVKDKTGGQHSTVTVGLTAKL
jgi:hypothetical protein